MTHGTLVTGNDGVAWNDKGNSTYQTIVKNNGALKVNIKPEDGYGLKSITVNNVAIDIDAAIKSGEIMVQQRPIPIHSQKFIRHGMLRWTLKNCMRSFFKIKRAIS